MKYIIGGLALLAAIGGWMYTHPKEFAEIAISIAISQVDISAAELLDGTTENLLSLCEESGFQIKMKLSREQCEQQIKDRKTDCMNHVRTRWDKAISGTAEIKEISDFYASCLLQPKP